MTSAPLAHQVNKRLLRAGSNLTVARHNQPKNGIFMNSVQPRQHRYAFLQRTASILLVTFLIAAPTSAQESAQPSKKILIETLLKIVEQLEAEKYAETEKYFYLPENFEHKMFAQLIKRDVISRRGVEALDLGGEYGSAIGVLRKSEAEDAAADFSAPVDQCFAMKMDQDDQRCKVIVHWTGEHFKILDISRVGKMDPDKVEVTVQAPLQPWPTGDKPTRELLVKTLRVFLHRIKNKHYDELRPNVYVPEDFQMSRFSDSLKRDELSEEGIKVLAAKGSFGKADQVYHKLRAEALTKRVQVPVDECYGYVAKIGGVQGEALAHWIGDRYKLLRADDIGKLSAVSKADEKPDAKSDTKETVNPGKPSPMPTKAPEVTAPKPTAAEPPTESQVMPSVAAAMLPKYETDKSVVIANYPALSQGVAANPNNVSQRARFVQSLLVIGNTPKAWTESVEIYRLDPQNIEVVYAIDQSIEALKKNGIFQVGVPAETIESLMGKPLKTADVDGIVRWQYPNWNVDFNDGRFIKLSRVKPAAISKPTSDEKPTVTATPKAVIPTTYSVEMSSFGGNKIAVIKVIRKLNKGMGLKEAKNLSENVPSIVLKGVSKEEAAAAKKKFIAAGASVEIK